MPIAYDSQLGIAKNLDTLNKLKTIVERGVSDDFSLLAILTQESGNLPGLNPIAEYTVYGDSSEVDLLATPDIVRERAVQFGEGFTTVTKTFRGKQAGEVAVGYAVHMIDGLTDTSTGIK